MGKMKLKRQVYNHLVKLATKSDNKEICGFILENKQGKQKLVQITNISVSSFSVYVMAPNEIFKVISNTLPFNPKSDWKILTCFHSHIYMKPALSSLDSEFLCHYKMLIYSLHYNIARIWKKENGNILEEELII